MQPLVFVGDIGQLWIMGKGRLEARIRRLIGDMVRLGLRYLGFRTWMA